MATGIVRWFNPTKGFGLIAPDDGGTDVFVHVAQVEQSGIRHLIEGQKVKFEVVNEPSGPKAINLAFSE